MGTVSSFDPRSLSPDEVIVHEIPQHPAARKEESIPLSTAPAPQEYRVLSFLRERITTSIQSYGVAAQFSPAAESPIPEIVTQIIEDPDSLVAASQRAAQHLYNQQPGVSPEGLLVALRGTIDSQLPAVALLKLQKQAGLRVHSRALPQGGQTLAIEILEELMLTEKTKVFKVGLFVRNQEDIAHALVADEQLRSNASGGVAAFFMRTLGCREADEPAVLTRKTFEAVGRFINEEVEEPEVKLRYSEALRAEIQSNQNTFEPVTFIERHIDDAHRDNVREFLNARDISLQPFVKDARGIQSQLKRKSLRTANNVKVSAQAETFADLVEVREIEGEECVVVRDKVVAT